MQMRFAASLISVPYCYVAAEEFEIVTKASDSQRYPLSPMLADELCDGGAAALKVLMTYAARLE